MFPTLETHRLILRRFNKDDIPEVHKYAGHHENVKYTLWGPNTDADTASFVFYAINEAERRNILDYHFAVISKESNELIGGSSVKLDQNTGAGIGYVLHRDFWGRGYGSELCARLLKFCFLDLKIRRVTATCDTENIGSYRVMEKNGMRREGHFKEARRAITSNGEWHDEYLYAILESEWKR